MFSDDDVDDDAFTNAIFNKQKVTLRIQQCDDEDCNKPNCTPSVVTSRRGRATKKITYAESDTEDSEDEAPKKNSRRGKKAAPKKAPAKGGKKKASRAYDSDSEEFELDLDSQDDDGDEDDDDESFKGDTEEDDSDDGVAAEGKRSKSNKDRNPKAKKRSKSGKSKSEPTKKIAWDEIDLNMDITASAENERLVNYRKAAEKIKKVSVVMNTMCNHFQSLPWIYLNRISLPLFSIMYASTLMRSTG